MANAFLNPKPIGKPMRAVGNNLAVLKNVGPKPKASGLMTEVAQQNRRISGVSPALVRGYQNRPARFVPKTKFNLASLGKMK